MTVGEIIFAVLVGIHGLCFLEGLALVIVYLINNEIKKSDKLILSAYILWAISPLFSIIGVFFGVFL